MVCVCRFSSAAAINQGVQKNGYCVNLYSCVYLRRVETAGIVEPTEVEILAMMKVRHANTRNVYPTEGAKSWLH